MKIRAVALFVLLFASLAHGEGCDRDTYVGFSKLDADGDGDVTATEWANVSNRLMNIINSRRSYTDAERQMLDANNDRQLSSVDYLIFRYVYSTFSGGTSSACLNKLRAFSLMDGDKDGSVEVNAGYSAYYAAMYNGRSRENYLLKAGRRFDVNRDGRVDGLDAAIFTDAVRMAP